MSQPGANATMQSSGLVSGRQPLISVAIAMAAGIMFDRYTPAPRLMPFLSAFGVLTIWILARRMISANVAQWLILLGVFATSATWHDARWRLFGIHELARYAGSQERPVCLRVIAQQAPRQLPAQPPDPLRVRDQEARSWLQVAVKEIRNGRTWEAATGHAILTAPGELEEIRAGDELQVCAVLSRITGPLNPGESDFSSYERTQRRLCRLYAPHSECVSISRRRAEWHVQWVFDSLRSTGESLLLRYVGPEQGGLATAILLGSRERLEAGDIDAFFKTGMVHILAISGMNVGILAYGLWYLTRLRWLSRQVTLLATCLLVFGYAILTGAEPPVLRAAVFVGAVCCGKWAGRRGLDFNTLALAGIYVLAINPSNLSQVGTQLSFLAVAALTCIGSRLLAQEPKATPLQRLRESSLSWPIRWSRRLLRQTWSICCISVGVWVVTTPLVWFRFQLLSPAALVLNPLTWLPIAAAMYSGFGVLLLGHTSSWLSQQLGWICHLSLATISESISVLLRVPGSHVFLPGPSWWWLVVFYVGCVVFELIGRRSSSRRWPWTLVAAWAAISLWTSPAGQRMSQPSTCLAATFLSVGHGGAIVVEYPDGQVLLYDAGQMSAPQRACRVVSSFLWYRGITHLDAIVVSHADTDHFNAIPALVERFSVGTIYMSNRMLDQSSDAVHVLRNAATKSSTPIRTLKLDDCLASPPGITTRVLHPPFEGVVGNDNSNSVVLEINAYGKRLLLTGDLEKSGLDAVIGRPSPGYSVVLIPHHGSSRSDPARFSEWTAATWGIVSGDDPTQVRGVMREYQTRGVIPLHTRRHGAVRFEFQPRRIVVTSFIASPRCDVLE